MLDSYRYYWANKDWIFKTYPDKMVIIHSGRIFKVSELSEDLFEIAPPLSLAIFPSADPKFQELCFIGGKF